MQEAPEEQKDPPEPHSSAFDYEAADFTTWSSGWHDRVYNEDSVNPDITLGELLLLYFEWMSVHQVTAFALLVSALVCVTD